MPIFGEPAITVEDKEYNATRSMIDSQLGLFRDKTKKTVYSRNWANNREALITQLTELFLIGKVSKRQDSFAQFAKILHDEFGVATPANGALWGGEGAEAKAKSDLGTAGSVLSGSALGKMSAKLGLAPQGPNKDETGLEYAERNKAGLQFWGALSALYAQGLTGDIHVWMPKGLTVGSIFWNDELPVLMKRKRDGENFNLIFHVNPGNWNETVNFDDLMISGAYVADKNGYYAGRADLKAKHNPPTGLPDDAAKDVKDSMTLVLSNPIKTATVKMAMQALLTYTVMKKHNNVIAEASRLDPSAPKPLSPEVLARLALWRERARIEAGKV